MKKSAAILTSLLFITSLAHGQTIVLDYFNSGNVTGIEQVSTSWIGQTTQNATTLTVGGTAKDDNGWGTATANVDATGLGYVQVIAQLDSGNVAPTFTIQFEDVSLITNVFSVATSSFNLSSLTTVYIPVSWTGGFDATQITGWTIGGGNPAAPNAFRMTFDNLALTASAVPEPSTYALMAGLACFGLIAIRRRLLKA